MKLALKYALIGGAAIAVALYLFPMYVGQEMFVTYLTEQSGGDYWTGVFKAAGIAGAVGIWGLLVIKTRMWGNPLYLGASLAVLALVSFIIGGL